MQPNAPMPAEREIEAPRDRRPIAMLLATLVAAGALLWLAGSLGQILLLAFAGLLFAIFLGGATDLLVRRTPLGRRTAFALVLAGCAALLVGFGWMLAPKLAAQIEELALALPEAFARVRERAEGGLLGDLLASEAASLQELAPSAGAVLSRAGRIFSSTVGWIANVVIVVFVGVYAAAQPALYVEGFLGLLPRDRRQHARTVLNHLRTTLRWWIAGRLFSMAVIGILTTVGLSLLGVRLALVIGILSGLLSFVPYVGPVLSAVPPVLIALAEGPRPALEVVLLYLAVQTVESYLLTPLVERRTVLLPPALTLIVQVLLGVQFGGLGLLLAGPLTAVASVLVKLLYVRDVLGDEVELPGD